MELIRIPAGEFLMGSPAAEKALRKDEVPQRPVTISKPFYMGRTEVTQAQYQAITGKNPGKFKSPANPVEQVSWADAMAFCKALSKKAGRTVSLPTEAQWEYACRAGAKTRFSFGTDDKEVAAHAWCKTNSDAKAQSVGRKKPNALGLYDMHGNVYEWCRDWYDAKSYASAKKSTPRTPQRPSAAPPAAGRGS